jgi:hypothetical protein
LNEDSVNDKVEDEEGRDVQHSFKAERDDEDAAISQLAAEIIGGIGSTKAWKSKAFSSGSSTTVKKHDPIQAILSAAGVQYTHENSEVIGSSKVEAQLSKRAEEVVDGGKAYKGEARVFFEDESQPQTAANKVADVKGYGGLRYRYRPPDEVKRRIFCTMAKWAGYNDPVTFALVVEGWTPANRRDFLTHFYQWRRDVLSWEANGKGSTRAEIKDEGIESKDNIKFEDDDEDDEL